MEEITSVSKLHVVSSKKKHYKLRVNLLPLQPISKDFFTPSREK